MENKEEALEVTTEDASVKVTKVQSKPLDESVKVTHVVTEPEEVEEVEETEEQG